MVSICLTVCWGSFPSLYRLSCFIIASCMLASPTPSEAPNDRSQVFSPWKREYLPGRRHSTNNPKGTIRSTRAVHQTGGQQTVACRPNATCGQILSSDLNGLQGHKTETGGGPSKPEVLTEKVYWLPCWACRHHLAVASVSYQMTSLPLTQKFSQGLRNSGDHRSSPDSPHGTRAVHTPKGDSLGIESIC